MLPIASSQESGIPASSCPLILKVISDHPAPVPLLVLVMLIILNTRPLPLIIQLDKCFSTFFGSRHPFRLKKIWAAPLCILRHLGHLKFDLDLRKSNIWRHPWHRFTAPRLGITDLDGPKSILNGKYFFQLHP